MKRYSRRRILKLSATGTLTALAGCQNLREQVDSRFDKHVPRTPLEGSDETVSATETAIEMGTETPDPTELWVPPSEVKDAPSFVAGMPMQEPTGDRQYATFGRDDPEMTATFYGSWKCAKTAAFVTGEFGTLIEEYIEPGIVAVEFRNIAYNDGHTYLGSDAPNAENVGLAVWNNSPDAFAEYFGTVFVNRPPTHTEWATAEQLTVFAHHAGVSKTNIIHDAIENDRYESALRETSTRVEALGLESIPRSLTGR